MSHNVLVVDDEPKLCDLLASALGQNDIQVFTAGNGLHALTVLEREEIDLVISDWRMPGMDGPQLLAEIKQRFPHLPVIVMTAYSTVKNAVQSMRNGAYDYISKPFDIDELDITVHKALQFGDILRDNQRLRAELDEHQQIDSLVGESPSFRRVLQAVDSVRESSATILLTGESGTGKEMVARAIHKHGNRADKPFVAVNCAAIPEGLLESEMFGHKKGAFTGAVSDRIGRFQQADKGTLFLDEVGDMPLALQAKILRALQERVIEPVGDPRERKVDVRVIAATNKNLLKRWHARSSARTCITASTCSRSRYLRCASGSRTSPHWPDISPTYSAPRPANASPASAPKRCWRWPITLGPATFASCRTASNGRPSSRPRRPSKNRICLRICLAPSRWTARRRAFSATGRASPRTSMPRWQRWKKPTSSPRCTRPTAFRPPPRS